VSTLDPVLIRGLSAIEPYLGEVVLAGGWVPHVYELVYDSNTAGRSPRTRDIDLAVPRSVPVRGLSIDKMLTAADFVCQSRSLSTPPVTRYVAVDDGQDIEIEFITDARGSSEATINVQPDLTAQELHYVGIMLDNPWPISLSELTDGAVQYTVRVPRPGAFVFHKALVFKKRSGRLKREKDLYYVFFVLEAFPAWRGVVASELGVLAAQKTTWFRKCLKNLRAIFDSPESSGVDALLNQRPGTAFPELNDGQFRQYAFSVMSALISTMDGALASTGE
jgi:hypothetical protein